MTARGWIAAGAVAWIVWDRLQANAAELDELADPGADVPPVDLPDDPAPYYGGGGDYGDPNPSFDDPDYVEWLTGRGDYWWDTTFDESFPMYWWM